MEDVFWAMMQEMPFSQITCKELYRRANVSHNTFYYYFKNIDDVAAQLFDRAAIKELPLMMLSLVAAGQEAKDIVRQIPNFEERFRKVRLMATNASSIIQSYMMDIAINSWLLKLGITEKDMTLEDHVDLTFLIGGAIATLGSEYSNDLNNILAFPQREIGQGLIAKLTSFQERGNKSKA